MAKRRILKKNIGCVAGDLFAEVLVCKLFIPGINQEQADLLMTRALDMQDNFVRRAGRPGGKDGKLVKNYYRKLHEDLQVEVDAIGKEIEALSKD